MRGILNGWFVSDVGGADRYSGLIQNDGRFEEFGKGDVVTDEDVAPPPHVY
ncbi:hypothetical protein WAI453_008077 [Rhynchosporium graminicola]